MWSIVTYSKYIGKSLKGQAAHTYAEKNMIKCFDKKNVHSLLGNNTLEWAGGSVKKSYLQRFQIHLASSKILSTYFKISFFYHWLPYDSIRYTYSVNYKYFFDAYYAPFNAILSDKQKNTLKMTEFTKRN